MPLTFHYLCLINFSVNMKVAIIGYGKMGREIERVLLERGHSISVVIDEGGDIDARSLAEADVAMEFSTPVTAFDNVRSCFEAGVPVVCGTTGWQDRIREVRDICERLGGTFFYSSNFSIGVNVFFAVNERLAELMNNFPQYEISMRETHHIHKKDTPSGTAVTLAEGILGKVDRKLSWVNHPTLESGVLGIESVREGEVFGIHEIKYESDTDSIELVHTSKNRRGLALGAVLAAEYALTHKGVLSMKDLLKI